MEKLKQYLATANILRFFKKKNLWTLVLVSGVFIFLGLAVWKEWDTLLSFRWQLNGINLAATIILHTLALGTMYLAWHFTMRQLLLQGNWHVDFKIFSLSMIARRIPFPIWYLGSRLYLYKQENVSASIVLTATTIETVLIGLNGIVCYVLLLPWYTYAQQFPWEIPFAIACLLMLTIVIRPRIFIDLINSILRVLKRPSLSIIIPRRGLILWSLLYLATWMIDGLGLYFTVAAFIPNPPPVISVIGISTISALVALVSMALPSGFGLKEITMGALLSAWMPLSAGVVISILYRLIQTIVEALWAYLGQAKISKLS